MYIYISIYIYVFIEEVHIHVYIYICTHEYQNVDVGRCMYMYTHRGNLATVLESPRLDLRRGGKNQRFLVWVR